jgi:hypothetical protein
MDVYRRGGYSLMGRYFLYRMHPFSVAEVRNKELPDSKRIIRSPQKIATAPLSYSTVRGSVEFSAEVSPAVWTSPTFLDR